MDNIFDQCLNGKTILEIGTGRGGTTRYLASLLSKSSNCKLITTDISDCHFQELKDELKYSEVNIEFIKTDACTLKGIQNNSVDYLVCNYTLCAINSEPGCETLALNKFKNVLKDGGLLYIEEEFPVSHIENEMQNIWSLKWKILKSCTTLLGKSTYNEMEPHVLKSILEILGFNNIRYETSVSKILGENCLDFFMLRVNNYIEELHDDDYIKCIQKISASLKNKAIQVGGMEIPSYILTAVK